MKLLAFDIDGTVLDTLDAIEYQVDESLFENGLNRVNEKAFIRKVLGYGSRYLIEKSLEHSNNEIKDKEVINKILKYYNDRYNANPVYLTKPYDGILDLLKELKAKGYILVAYSNKPDNVLQPLIEEVIPSGMFEFVLGNRDEFPAKPNPTVLEKILKDFGVKKEEACYIGDSEVDILTGKNAGVKTIAVSWGFRDRDVLEESEPDYIVDNMEELKEIIYRIGKK